MQSSVGERGATLLDVVVGSALMMLVFVGITGAFQLSIDAVTNNKSRAGAIALANERLEYIRSLNYDAIGTLGGVPAGALLQSEPVSINDVSYTRRTFVSYEDDAGDGLGGADSNGITVDYKAAKVSVSWPSRQGARTITMTTRISPPTGIESAVPGGTIAVQVTDAATLPIQNAQVRIVNSTVSPAIDLTTYTDSAGLASVIGAPAGAGYALSVTKAGYSTGQTYGATASNTNPIPAHLGVALNQTTAATFAIDVLGSHQVATFESIEEATWTDSFADVSKVSTTTAIEISGGTAHLDDGGSGSYPNQGALISNLISIPYLVRWKEFSWARTTPAGTGGVFHVYDDAWQLIPDAEVPGNAAGFTVSPVSLLGVSTSTHGTIRVGANLTTLDASTTPSIQSWNVVYDVGPIPLPNITFTMQGVKTIGSGPTGPVYKYSVNHSSGAAGNIVVPSMEYDSYTLSVSAATGFDIASSCGPQPTSLGAGQSVVTQLYLSPHTTNSLLIDVKSAGGALLPGASVQLSRGAYNTTITADQCGQAFFNGLSSGSVGTGNPYAITVTAGGYSAYTSTEVNVSGTTRLSIILN